MGPGPTLDLQLTLPWPYNTPNMALYILTIFLHSMPQIWDQVTQWRQMLTPIGSRTRLGPSMDPAMALQYTKHGPLYIGYIFVFYATKWDQWTLGAQRTTLIGFRTCLGSSMDPAMALQYTQHGPLYIGYIFAFYATKMESMDSEDTKVHPH